MTSRRTPARSRWSVALTATILGTALLGSACSSTTATGTQDSADTDFSGERSSDEFVAGAQELIQNGIDGLLTADKPEPDIQLADWQTVDGWEGPPNPVAAPEGKKVYAIACATAAPFCDDVTKGVVEAAEQIGWDATYLDGAGSPQGFATAFQTAIAARPDAIVTMALPESVVGRYLAEARQAGIKLIGISSVSEEGTPESNKYDAYVSARETANAELQAWYAIADTDGKARIGYLWDPAYPFLTEALDAAKGVLEQCSGCEIEVIQDRQLSTAADPTKYQQLAESVIQQHPDLTHLMLPYGLGAPSVVNAVKTRGRDIKIVSKNSDPINIGLVHQGQLAFEVGTSAAWVGWSGVDQTIRLLAGQPPLEEWQSNLPIHVYVPSNAPESGTFDWDGTGFRDTYLTAWGAGT